MNGESEAGCLRSDAWLFKFHIIFLQYAGTCFDRVGSLEELVCSALRKEVVWVFCKSCFLLSLFCICICGISV